MLYRNISPFCEPLSFVHQLDLFALPHEFSFALPYEFFTLYFRTNFLLLISIRIFCVSYNFSLLISIRIFLLSLQQIDWYTLLILDLISIRISPLFAQIDYHTFYIALHLYHTNFYMNFEMLYPWKQWIWLYYLYYSNFWCKTHLTMSLIVFFF